MTSKSRNMWKVVKEQKGKYFLEVNENKYLCQLGENGLIEEKNKIEGDKATPLGQRIIKSIYYRADKINLKINKYNISLPLKTITPNCGWCDDLTSQFYNQYVFIKNNHLKPQFHYEKLWREDDVYDIVLVIDYNLDPIIKGKGSAIFIHCSFKDIRSTSGCVALDKKQLIKLTQSLTKKTIISL